MSMQIEHIMYPLTKEMLQSVPQQGQSMAIGDFDGVHLGHQEVIAHALRTSSMHHIPSAVMTFHPHPREVLGLLDYAEYLTPLDRKCERFEQLGVQTTYVVTFDKTLAGLSPDVFIAEFIHPLRVRHISVGFNFTFGFRGLGTVATLSQLSTGAYEVEVVPPYLLNDEIISSTSIRKALSTGNINRANHLLGRPYAIRGTVVHGEGRGRTIGIPTANIQPAGNYVIPTTGVYAVEVTVRTGPRAGRLFQGVMNIGFKPTFHQMWSKSTLEVHLFDVDEDMYGEEWIVRCKSRIREERKFDSIDALLDQIRTDIQIAHQIFQVNR